MYTCSLLTFIRRVRSSLHYKPVQPIIVHCSAGVGRTGTFILIDAMLEMAKIEKQIDVLKHFCVIRLQRINLVEKLGQYVFAHQALLEALSHESTSIDCNDFENYYRKLSNYDYTNKSSPLMTQFQVLSHNYFKSNHNLLFKSIDSQQTIATSDERRVLSERESTSPSEPQSGDNSP